MAESNGVRESASGYAAYIDSSSGTSRIGRLDLEKQQIQPLAFKSGTPIADLYQVIEVGSENIIPDGEAIPRSSVTLLAPISGRDVLAVGKNYAEHAIEFNSSGYDSSDKMDQPTHPVIFTKRATSIIADGEEIFPHPGFTETVDYEGEIGVIVGKAGYRVSVENAMDYVWGYTIINDMTARERQRDHKQFYIGKSPDTFCPMGPIAVPKEELPKTLRVQTFVNGAKRQEATTDDLIFSVAFLIHTLSEGITLQPGDVLATGTPAGVGFGQKPPVWLKPGEEVAVSVTGLGTLRNKIATPSSANTTTSRVEKFTHVPVTNFAKSCNGVGLTKINGKQLYYQQRGSSGPPIFYVHGLGGTNDYFTPLINSLDLPRKHASHLFDLEGHGLSPSSAASTLSISSFAEDLKHVYTQTKASDKSGATLIAHSMGCLVALKFAIENPNLIQKLILMGPPPSPLPAAGSQASHARAALARSKGMSSVVDAVATAGTSEQTKQQSPVGLTAVRLSLLGQDPEGYAKACSALANATDTLDISKVTAKTLIITGDEDKVSPPELCRKMKAKMKDCSDVVVLENVGHWHLFEDPKGVADAVGKFLET